MSHLAPAVIVLEKGRRLESQLKRLLEGSGRLIRPCRSARDLLELCQQMPGSAAVIDVESGAAAALACLERAFARRIDCWPIIVAGPDALPLEWAFREAGALAVLPDTASRDLANLCRRLVRPTASSLSESGRRRSSPTSATQCELPS